MKRNTRELLLETGAKLVLTSGFNGCGVNELLAGAKIPKGSFYYHFSSKENFGLELVNYFGNQLIENMQTVTSGGYDALKQFFDETITRFKAGQPAPWLILVKLEAELGVSDCALHKAVVSYFDQFRDQLIHWIAAGRQTGRIDLYESDDYIADFLVDIWKGAWITANARKAPDALQRAADYMFNWLLP